MSDHRNTVKIVYGEPVPTRIYREPLTLVERVRSWFGFRPFDMRDIRPSARAENAADVVRYGRRLLVVSTEPGEIRTPEQARALAGAILNDLRGGEPETTP